MLIIASCSHARKQQEAIVSARNIELRDSIFRAQHFDTGYIYSKPVCPLYNKKPLLKIGQRVSELPKELGYRFDPNLDFQEYYGVITDYLSLSEYFTITQSKGSVNGIVLFAADERDNRIFHLKGNWLFDTDTSRAETIAALDSLRKKVFPCLPPAKALLKRRSMKINNGDFTEIFELTTPKEAEKDSSAFQKYDLHYSVSLNPK
ncbi:hypothetical protein [Hymenobacter terricola]|uniref:hypothetical protein n=1 Tax=Hymenobacter terricola TaxID=2819236 RepID=UPI001B3004A3|nr:hypothetical protein [Hymenobacter terricola]